MSHNNSRATIYMRSGWRKYVNPIYWYSGLMYCLFLASPYPMCAAWVNRLIERFVLGHAGHFGNWDAYDLPDDCGDR